MHRWMWALLLLVPSTAPGMATGPGPALVTEAGFKDARDLDPVTLIVRFRGAPELTPRCQIRTVILEFGHARFPDRIRSLLAGSDLVEAAGLEQIDLDRVRLTMRVRAGCTVQVYRFQPDPGAEVTYALVVQHEMSKLGTSLQALTYPVKGRVTSHYGWRVHPVLRGHRMHHGVDIAVPTGTPIHALDAGEVTFAGWHGGGGHTVVIRHASGLETAYKHCSQILVKKGDRVTRHQVVGKVGQTGITTGPHLHFEMLRGGVSLDPMKYHESVSAD